MECLGLYQLLLLLSSKSSLLFSSGQYPFRNNNGSVCTGSETGLLHENQNNCTALITSRICSGSAVAILLSTLLAKSHSLNRNAESFSPQFFNISFSVRYIWNSLSTLSEIPYQICNVIPLVTFLQAV